MERDPRFLVRLAAGIVFVAFGVAKFGAHAEEVHSFERYGLPQADAFVYLIGAIEVGGGLLLVAGLATRLVALVLAGDMVGAIVVAGIGEGEVVPSLTLAPLLLVAMGYLVRAGAGPASVDARLLRRRPAPG